MGTLLMSSKGDIFIELRHSSLYVMSKLFRNVPFLDSLEMSPFSVPLKCLPDQHAVCRDLVRGRIPL